MKTLGIWGHVSYESSLVAQQIICQEVVKREGKLASPRISFFGDDFRVIKEYLDKPGQEGLLDYICPQLQKYIGPVDAMMIVSNTLHLIVPELEQLLGIPFIHIVDCTGDYIAAKGFKKVALLGTKKTMNGSFYKDRLLARAAGLEEVMVPEEKAQDYIDLVIHERLCNGIILNEDRFIFRGYIEKLEKAGAEAVVLGCTEVPLLIKANDVHLPIIDTLKIQALAAVDFMLS